MRFSLLSSAAFSFDYSRSRDRKLSALAHYHFQAISLPAATAGCAQHSFYRSDIYAYERARAGPAAPPFIVERHSIYKLLYVSGEGGMNECDASTSSRSMRSA